MKEKRRKETRENEAKIFQIEILEQEILNLRGETKEKALNAYRKLLRSLNKPIYLDRSE